MLGASRPGGVETRCGDVTAMPSSALERPSAGAVLSRWVPTEPTPSDNDLLRPVAAAWPSAAAPPVLDETHISAIVHRSADVAMFFEADGTIVWVSPASVDVFGIAPEDLVGRCGFDLIHPEDLHRVVTAFAEGLAGSGGPVRVEFRLPDDGGPTRWVEEIVTDLSGDPQVGFLVGNLRDITERKMAEQAMSHLALVDDLTGLPNRNALSRALAAVEDAPTAGDAGLILFDLDDFCDVNDTMGHGVGDALLVAVAHRVRAALSEEFLVARFGDDQFAVFGQPLSCERTSTSVAAAVRAAVGTAFHVAGHDLLTSATMGIAVARGARVAELIGHADAALSHAKRVDRGGHVIFRPEIAEEAARRLRRTVDLRRAVSGGEIVAHYQPIVELGSGRVVAVEALARWNHAEHDLVSPSEFIPLAETTGLIEELGRQIIGQSCADAAEWNRRGRALQLNVNASGVQLNNPSFVAMIDAALAASGLPARQLTLEITETAAVRDPAIALSVLNALQERSIVLSLDDFGTGYSPLTALRDLPISAIKLDRSFVAALGTPTGDGLAEGIIELGRSVGVYVVAEGVETIAQADRLRDLGCLYGQGYLWSPAVPAEDLLAIAERIERSVRTRQEEEE